MHKKAANYHEERRREPAPVCSVDSDSTPHFCDSSGTLVSRCQIDPDPRTVFGTRPFPSPRFGQALLRANY
ncbi:MAG: hypothetical protein J6C26_08110 [Clostridia bacterium]|nr:hypothetical protein [Clostridia bacterium]